MSEEVTYVGIWWLSSENVDIRGTRRFPRSEFRDQEGVWQDLKLGRKVLVRSFMVL